MASIGLQIDGEGGMATPQTPKELIGKYNNWADTYDKVF